jgi:hypothetical protein
MGMRRFWVGASRFQAHARRIHHDERFQSFAPELRRETNMHSRIFVALLLMFALPAAAQVVREDNTASIAGALVPTPEQPLPQEEWKFRSAGGEILFASLDAEIYLTRTEDHEAALAAEEEPGGCEDEGGPGHFYLSVLTLDGVEICRAERPAPPPGWQRDPRMACVLPGPGNGTQESYVLRVGLLGTDEEPQESYAFLLDVSLRPIARDRVNIQEAIARSRNRF